MTSTSHPLRLLGALVLLAAAVRADAGPRAYVANGGGYAYTDNTVSVIDSATNTVVKTIAIGIHVPGDEYTTNFRAVTMNPAGTRVYVGDYYSDVVHVINTATDAVIAEIPVGVNPFGIAINGTGTRLFVTNDQYDSVRFIDATNNSVIRDVDVFNPANPSRRMNPYGVVANLAGTRLYVTNNSDNTVSVIDTALQQQVASIQISNLDLPRPYGIAINPAGTRVYVANAGENTLVVIDATTNSVIKTIPGFSGPIGVTVSHDGKRVYVADQNDGELWVIDAVTNSAVTSVFMGGGLGGISLSPDGTRAYMALNTSHPGKVAVFNTLTNTAVNTTITVGEDPLSMGQFMQPDNIFIGSFEQGPK